MHDAFSLSSTPVITGLQDRVESLLLHGSKLYLGCQNGSLHIYSIHTSGIDGDVSAQIPGAKLERVIKGFSKKSIEQLGVINETDSLVSLADGAIYLHDLQTLEQQTALGSSSQTKGQAGIFALETSIQHGVQPTGSASRGSKMQAKATPTASPAKVPAKRAGDVKGKGKGAEQRDDRPDAPTVVTTLAVGCRRRLVIFSWRDGQWQDPKEVALPHQIRSLAFPLPHSLFLGFSTSEYGIVSLPFVPNPASTVAPALGEVFAVKDAPPPAAASGSGSSLAGASTGTTGSHLGAIPGLGGLGGLAVKTGGYMGLGGKVDRNIVIKVRDGEVLVQKDTNGILLDAAGKSSRSNSIEYALPPEENVTCWPFVVSLLPAPAAVGNLSKQQLLDPLTALPTLHIHAIPNLSPTQAIRVPPLANDAATFRPSSIIDMPSMPVVQSARLLTTGPKGKSPLAVLTHPLSEGGLKSTPANAGSVYLLSLRPWPEQIASLKSLGKYEEALSLLSSLDSPDRAFPSSSAADMLKSLRILRGLSLFLNRKKYDDAIDVFIEENVNPAKVVALFPKAISGKLFCEREDVEGAWGGRTRDEYVEQQQKQSTEEGESQRPAKDRRRQQTADSTVSAEPAQDPEKSSSWHFSSTPSKKKAAADDDTASIKSKRSYLASLRETASGGTKDSQGFPAGKPDRDELSYKLSVDVLMRYLPDRRQQILRALAALPPRVRPSPSTPLPSFPSKSAKDLFAFPDEAMTSYTPQQLQRTAQVVETALFKCYLHAKPGLLGPLCRIENWCEVEEVEELLMEAKKYRELLDLYNGKQMHEKAIKLLQRMADDNDTDSSLSSDDRLQPTIAYLQKLGPQHLELIFSASQWVFDHSSSPLQGLDIFVADIEEVESLPRHAVSLHLSKHANKAIYIGYLEHIVNSLDEKGPEFHERLAELYLDEVDRLDALLAEKEQKGDVALEEERREAYEKLRGFLEASTQYRADRLLGRIAEDKMWEIRAILLGKLGQHEGALQIYVYRLGDHKQAEEYCKREYDPEDAVRRGIFLTLLKVYLRPRKEGGKGGVDSQGQGKPLFAPALHLLSTQSTKLDPGSVLDLLPPLLTVEELSTFLRKSVRRQVESVHGKKVGMRVWRARLDQVERDLVGLEERRVKITDSRLCPECHKRLGNSVIAFHSPRGEVTHYHCRERWLERKKQDIIVA